MILGDYHTHTRFSHGKGKIYQSVEVACSKGLKQVGISDHGLRHIAFGLRQLDIYKMKRNIESLKDKYNIDILFGIEANIYSSDGSIDVKGVNSNYFDYIIAGFHLGVWPKNIIDFFRFNVPAVLKSKNHLDVFTKSYVKAMMKNKINIIPHLNYAIKVDTEQVAKTAVDYGVLIELNGKRIDLTDEQILRMQQIGVNFIINSDAHSADRVGDFSVPMKVVERLNLNKAQIANWDKIPNFYKQL